MGGVFKKLCRTRSCDAIESVESPEEFYTSLRLELEDDEIYCLKYLFYSIKLVEQEVGRDLYKFVTTKKFRNNFKYELDKNHCKIHTEYNLHNSLMDHCFAIIWVHFDILNSIQSASSASFIHTLLYDVAACHGHFKDFNEHLEIHDSIFYNFIKIEFEEYTSKFTLQALGKYLSVISYRIVQLKEDIDLKQRDSAISRAVQEQRTSLGMRFQEANALRKIYSGVRIDSSSTILLQSTEGTTAKEKFTAGKLEKIPSKNSESSISTESED